MILGTGMGLSAFVLTAVLIIVDFLIYLPFCKAYDKVLAAEEAQHTEPETAPQKSREIQPVMAGASEDEATVISTNLQESSSALEHGTNVLVLCAGAGTSAMLANALTEGAEEYNVPITASAGAYGSHYDIMKDFDMIILAPQVGSYYDDIKEDASRLHVKLVATKGAEYISLTRNSQKAIQFILEHTSK